MLICFYIYKEGKEMAQCRIENGKKVYVSNKDSGDSAKTSSGKQETASVFNDKKLAILKAGDDNDESRVNTLNAKSSTVKVIPVKNDFEYTKEQKQSFLKMANTDFLIHS
jgi:hypothetical protein